MWTSSILIIIATLAGLLSLWREEIITIKEEPEEKEANEEKNTKLIKELKKEKTIKLKLITSIFIFLTLGFSIFEIINSNSEAKIANEEKIQQREEDKKAYRRLDSIKTVQERAYEAQILAGKTVDSIRIKSESIIKNLSKVDLTLSKNNKTITESAKHALSSFQELSNTSQRLLYPLDDPIEMDFSFGFWSSKTENVISEYLEVNNIKDDFIKIDESFPYYNEIQEVLKNSELNVRFYDAGVKDRMINNETGATMYDYIGTPPMLELDNSESLIFIPHREREGPNPGLIYIWELPDSHFEMNYIVPSKLFFFTSDKLSMKIVRRQDEYFSILDYGKSIAILEFKTPEVRDNPDCFLNLNTSFVDFNINFSNKKTTEKYKVEPLNFYGNNIWPEFYIDSVSFRR